MFLLLPVAAERCLACSGSGDAKKLSSKWQAAENQSQTAEEVEEPWVQI